MSGVEELQRGVTRRSPRERVWQDLSVTHPRLAAQWHPTRNGSVTADMVDRWCDDIVWWSHLSPDGSAHEWAAAVSARARGAGCPKCNGRVRFPLTVTHPDVAAEWHPVRNGSVTPDSVSHGSARRAWWQHVAPDGVVHEWADTVANRSRGRGCPACAEIRAGSRTVAEAKPRLVTEWHPTRNGGVTPEVTPVTSDDVVWWRHVTVNGDVHEWEAPVRARARNGGRGCPLCRRSDVSWTVTHPDVAAEWHPTRNEGLQPGSVTRGAAWPVWWQHVTPEGDVHEWQAYVFGRVKGSGCPECARGRRRHR